MDTRFPPQPQRVRVPLYPQKTKFALTLKRDAERKLLNRLRAYLQCRDNQLLIATSASAALCAFLKQAKGSRSLKVALPAFNCTSVVEAIVNAGCVPVFIDLEKNMSLSSRSIEYITAQRCSYVLWPNYFGARKRSAAHIKALWAGGVQIIFDEAQAFPAHSKNADYLHYKNADLVLFSFGPTKSLAGAGGGALYMPRPSASFNQAKDMIEREPIRSRDNIARSRDIALNRLALRHPQLVYKLKLRPKPALKLDTLLEGANPHWDNRLRISPHEAQSVLKQLDRIEAQSDRHQAMYEQVIAVIQDRFSTSALQFIRGIQGIPAILAIKVKNQRRYNLFKTLAAQGIQATWYYYPLSSISRYKKYPSEPIRNTYDIAAAMLILPFQWEHSKKQQTKLLRALISLPKETTRS